MKSNILKLSLTIVPFFLAHCAHPVLAKTEIYAESTKIPFHAGLQTDVRGRYTLLEKSAFEAFVAVLHESYTPLSSDTSKSSRSGFGVGLKATIQENFGVVIEERSYWPQDSQDNANYQEFRSGIYFSSEQYLSEMLLWKNYIEVFYIPRISDRSLTSSAYSRLQSNNGHPRALQIAPYLELSATENSDNLAFGNTLREVKTGLSLLKKWPETSVEILIFKNWLERPKTGPSEIRSQIVIYGVWP